MPDTSRLKRALRRFDDRYEAKDPVFRAIYVSDNGNGTHLVDYLNPDGSRGQRLQARGPTGLWAGVICRVSRDRKMYSPDEWVIIGRDASGYGAAAPPTALELHGDDHGLGRRDQIPNLDTWQLIRLRVEPQTGMVVRVLPGIFYAGTSYHYLAAVTTLDLTAHIPAGVNKYAFVAISIDAAGALTATKGTEVFEPTAEDIPTAPVGKQALAAVLLANGDTTLNQSRFYADLRFLSGGLTGEEPGGANKQVQYNNSGSFGGASGFEWQNASPNTLIQAQNAAHVPLVSKGAAAQTANLQQWQNSAGTTLTLIDAAGRIGFTTPAAGVTTEGYLWNDSTQKAIQAFVAGIEQTITGCIFTQTASATVGNTTTETTLMAAGVGTVTLPANFFVVGKTIRVVMRGFNSTTNPAGTMTFRVKLGATTILTTSANTIVDDLVNRAFDIQFMITCRTTGATGTVFSQGTVLLSTGADTSIRWEMVNTATNTINTTVAQALDITIQWGTQHVSNTITATNAFIHVLN